MKTKPLSDMATILLRWQSEHGRNDLAWQKTNDPYPIWLAEIMLQQTQVSTVARYYPRFLQRFPTLVDLVKAPIDEVLRLWAGLGYYRRAHLLHRCAQILVREFAQGQMIHYPRTVSAWQDLPGIGRSTAGAIVASAFNIPAPILDGNVRRVFTRVFFGYAQAKLMAKSREKTLWTIAEQFLPSVKNHARQWNQALMDLGNQLCKNTAQCEQCCWQSFCAYRQSAFAQSSSSATATIKIAQSTPLTIEPLIALGFIDRRSALPFLYLEKRPDDRLWAGLYGMPLIYLPAGWSMSACNRLLWTMIKTLSDCGLIEANPRVLTAFNHRLTHRHFRVQTLWLTIKPPSTKKNANKDLPSATLMQSMHRALMPIVGDYACEWHGEGLWQSLDSVLDFAIPTLVRKTIERSCDPYESP